MRSNLILAFLAAVLAVPTVLTVLEERLSFTEYDQIPRLFEGFTPENVAIIVVSTPKKDENGEPVVDEKGAVQRDALQFVKQDGKWVLGNTEIAGVVVREDKVREHVLDHLQTIRADEEALVQKDADEKSLETYGLTDASGALIQCYDATRNPLAAIYVGKDTAEGQFGPEVVRGYYVRRQDSADVILYEHTYWQTSADREHWVDRNPLRFDIGKAVELTIANPSGKVVFFKTEPTDVDWQVREGRPDGMGAVRSAEVTQFVETLSFLNIQLHVQKLPPPGPQLDSFLKQHGLDDPSLWTSVALADGTKYTVSVGKPVPGKNERYLRISHVDLLMTVGDWILAPLERKPSAYFDPGANAVLDPKNGDATPPAGSGAAGEEQPAGGGETGGTGGPGKGAPGKGERGEAATGEAGTGEAGSGEAGTGEPNRTGTDRAAGPPSPESAAGQPAGGERPGEQPKPAEPAGPKKPGEGGGPDDGPKGQDAKPGEAGKVEPPEAGATGKGEPEASVPPGPGDPPKPSSGTGTKKAP